MRLAAIVLLLALPGIARADELVTLTGRVFAADGRTPLAGALVAVYDDRNRVVDYARTDSSGRYALAVPRGALHLDRKGRGFLHQVTSGISRLVGGVGGVLKAGIRAGASTVGNADPAVKLGATAASGLAQLLVDQSGKSPANPRSPERKAPGALLMKVSAPGCVDAVAVARTYWMEEEAYHAGGREQRAVAAWMDPVHLASPGPAAASTIGAEFLAFTEARLEPSIAERGQRVRLTVAIPRPPEPRTPIVVVARNARTGRIYELQPASGDRWQCEFQVDRTFPRDDQTLCVLAYAQQGSQPGRSRAVEDAISRAGLWNPARPFVYNPLLVVSRTRAEVVLTVVEPPRGR